MKVGVLLAAGASTRMGSAKATVKTKGESFAAHGVRALWAVCDTVIVVLGHDAKRLQKAIEAEFVKLVGQGRLHDDLQTAHRHGAAGLEVHFELNRAWKKGMYGSAVLGLREALALKPEAVVLMPVDHPNVKANTVRALGAAMDAALGAYKGSKADKKRFAYAVVPRFKGHRGHPCCHRGSPPRSPRIGPSDLSDDPAERAAGWVPRRGGRRRGAESEYEAEGVTRESSGFPTRPGTDSDIQRSSELARVAARR